MKTLFLLLILPFVIYAQQDSTKVPENKHNAFMKHNVVLDLIGNAQFPFSGGSQFLNQIYRFNPALGYGTRISYRGIYGFGIELYGFQADIKDPTLIGPFKNATFRQISYYVFGQMKVYHKLNGEMKLGLGNMNIRHEFNGYDYYLYYQYFLIGTGLHYSVNPSNSLKIYLNYDLNFVKATSDQELPEPFKDHFSKSRMSSISLGIKFSFW